MNVCIYVLFILPVSLRLNFLDNLASSLLRDSVTSLPLLLVITCLGPPLPAARDDLGTEVEIKRGSEVSAFQKQPPLCQLPYPPLLSQWALKLTAKTRQISC